MIPIACVEDNEKVRGYFIKKMHQFKPNTYLFYEYENGKHFIDVFPTENYTPAIVLMDLSMPFMNGYDTTTWIKKHYPSLPVLVISEIDNFQSLNYFVRCGANGFLDKFKSYEPDFTNKVIELLINGEEYFKELPKYEIAKKRMSILSKELKKGVDSLTDSEMNVIRYLTLEKTTKEKAKILNISESGYKRRLKKIFSKLGVTSSNALYKFSVSIGLIKHY